MFSDREVALKTGTTNDLKDVWALGYTPQITVGHGLEIITMLQ
jgi:membrane carboxypeptidase/penicillin-binding protein